MIRAYIAFIGAITIVCGAVYYFEFRSPKLISEQITAVVVGPLPGEYGYEINVIRTPKGNALNGTSRKAKVSNILKTINYIEEFYPNVKKVGLVVGWYSDDIKAESMKIVPKVDSRINVEWQVAEYTRNTAPLMNKDVHGDPNWVGTPTDKSVVELAKLLHDKGIEVTFYPFIFIDKKGQPWRGEIHANSQQSVDNFFKHYEKFIMHYANLEYDGVKFRKVIKRFLIGSELEALLQFQNSTHEFPAVEKMIELAAKVRDVVGSRVEISYAANWTEYSQTSNGWYHLDKLWADKNIDFVGIDAYFPITNTKDLSKKDTFENVSNWWSSIHTNPNKIVTKWKPKMKPIVFAEIGFTPLKHTSNDPSLYVDVLKKNYGIPNVEKELVNAKYQYDAISTRINDIKKLNKSYKMFGIIDDVFWYNIEPIPNEYSWLYDHSIKVSDYEKGNKNLKKFANKSVPQLLKNAPEKLNH